MRVRLSGSTITAHGDNLTSDYVEFPGNEPLGFSTNWTVSGNAPTRKLLDPNGHEYSVELPTQTAPAPGGGGVNVDNGTDPPAAVTTLVAPGAVIVDGAANMLPAVIADDDPGAIGAGVFWLQTNINGSFAQLHCRDLTDADWITLTPIFDTTAGSGSQIIDTPDGLTELVIQQAGTSSWVTDSAIAIRRYGPNVRFVIDGDGYHMQDLPTSDPGIAGVLYSNGVPSAGVPKALMVSGG